MNERDDADAHGRWYPWFRLDAERAIFDELGMHALYCAGPEVGNTVRIAVSADPRRQLTLMQIDCWRPISVQHVAWCPDRDMADRLKGEVCEILAGTGRHLRGDWYDCPSPFLSRVISLGSEKIGCPILTHPAMLARVRSVREHRVKRAMRS